MIPCLILISSLIFIKPASAEAPVRSLADFTVLEDIQYYSALYGTSETVLEHVARCESGLNPLAIGDHGLARNVMQFHKETFDRWSKQLGEDLDYTSYHDQIKLGAWAFAHGSQYQKAWTCWTKEYKIKK